MDAAILDALPAHLALLDAAGTIVAVNAAWRRFAETNQLQWSQGGVGEDYLAVCDRVQNDPGGEARQAAAGIRRVLRGEVAEFSLEYPCHSPAEQRWFRLTATPVSSPPGRGAVVMHLNITAQHQAEEALRRSHEQQTQLAAQLAREKSRLIAAQRVANVGSWETDLATMAVTWSDETHRIFGTDPGAFQPTHAAFLALVHPDDRAAVDAAFQRSVASVDTQTIEHRVLLPDGRIKQVEERWQVFPDPAGRSGHAIGICRDLTEHIRTEEKLREQAALLDKASDAIIVRDLEHRILYWNRSAEKLYGWTAAEALGQSVQDLLYGLSSDYQDATKAVLATGEWQGEIEQCTKDGRRLMVQGSWTLVRDPQGRPKEILAINTDVTEQLKLEQKFLRAQRLESIGTLAGGIAHDLNNLLSPIVMGAGLLQNYELPGPGREVLKNIERSAKRGADLVKQVLSFARGVAGERVPLQPGHLIREIRDIAANTFPKNITFTIRVSPDLWLVLADATQLNQVLLNLCVNARDAMPDGGTLTVTAANREIDGQYAATDHVVPAGRYVVIEVADTGCGMTREVQERIFEPFFTTKELGKGTGLGLSTVFGIVRDHGGAITVQSEPGRGSTFRIWLPVHGEPTTADTGAGEAETHPRGRGELILLVDDEDLVLTITQQTLEAYGYRVICAHDGAQAVGLYALRQQEIALVLTDLMMPVMDGPMLIAALQRINPRVRLVAASGLNTSDYMARAVSLGVQHFLGKPYTAAALLVMMEKVLTAALPARSSNPPH